MFSSVRDPAFALLEARIRCQKHRDTAFSLRPRPHDLIHDQACSISIRISSSISVEQDPGLVSRKDSICGDGISFSRKPCRLQYGTTVFIPFIRRSPVDLRLVLGSILDLHGLKSIRLTCLVSFHGESIFPNVHRPDRGIIDTKVRSTSKDRPFGPPSRKSNYSVRVFSMLNFHEASG